MVQKQCSDPELVCGGYVVGVDLGGTSLRLALADMQGCVVGRWSTSSAGIQDPAKIVGMIVEGVDELLHARSVSRSELRAIAAGAPGVTDVDAGVVIVTSYLMGWRNVPLRALLEEALGVLAAIDNDVNVAALAEGLDGSAKGHRDFVFLAIGSGVGAGIVLHGKVFHGGDWSAGEIGYMMVPGTSEEPVERGRPGALEGLVGGEGIRAAWRREGGSPAEHTATEVFERAVAGDVVAGKILDQAARTLAYAIYDIALILNCKLFVLGGSVGMHPALREAAAKILEEHSARVRPVLVGSSLGTEAQVMGAVRLAIETVAKSQKGLR